MPWRPQQPSQEEIDAQERRKSAWWLTPNDQVHPLYPGEAGDSLVGAAKLEQQQKIAESLGQTAFGTSMLWKTLHFAFVSPVLDIDLRYWFRVREFVDYHDMEDYIYESLGDDDQEPDFSDYWKCEQGKLVDLDLQDGAGKIWKMRMVWVEGGGAMESYYGYYGKVFDRADPGKRVLCDINQGYQSETEFNRTEHLQGFVDHDNIKGIMQSILQGDGYLESILASVFYTFPHHSSMEEDDEQALNQPSFLMALALFAARSSSTNVQPHWHDNTRLLSNQLRLLGKPPSNENDASAARQVFCEKEDLRELIVAHALEPYVLPCNDDHSMDWYTCRFRWLCHAARYHAEGKDQEAQAAYRSFCREEQDRAHEDQLFEGLGRYDLPRALSIYQPWLLGMEQDKDIFPSLEEEQMSSAGKRKERD